MLRRLEGCRFPLALDVILENARNRLSVALPNSLLLPFLGRGQGFLRIIRARGFDTDTGIIGVPTSADA